MRRGAQEEERKHKPPRGGAGCERLGVVLEMSHVPDANIQTRRLNRWIVRTLRQAGPASAGKTRVRWPVQALSTLATAIGLHMPARAVDCSPVLSNGHPLTVCRADLAHDSIRLFLNDADGHPFHTIAALEKSLAASGQRLTFAMNAGMFQPDYSPVGLFIEQGRQLTPLNLKNERGNFFLKPNGVFYISDTGARASCSPLNLRSSRAK